MSACLVIGKCSRLHRQNCFIQACLLLWVVFSFSLCLSLWCLNLSSLVMWNVATRTNQPAATGSGQSASLPRVSSSQSTASTLWEAGFQSGPFQIRALLAKVQIIGLQSCFLWGFLVWLFVAKDRFCQLQFQCYRVLLVWFWAVSLVWAVLLWFRMKVGFLRRIGIFRWLVWAIPLLSWHRL